jgi:predicted ATP-grasp superfamily ATP-dependent carboligase
MAVLRSLGKRGIPVTVTAEHKNVQSYYSKYCRDFMIYPSARLDVRLFARSMIRYVARNHFEALFSMGDLTLWPISKWRGEFERHVKLALPAHSSVEQSFNKLHTIQLAKKIAVPVPETFWIRNVDQLRSISARMHYPAVIKPRFSWFWISDKTTSEFNLRPEYANTAGELVCKYMAIHEKSPFPLIQEYVPGSNYSVAVLCKDSRVKASCFIKVYRADPVMGGNSTYRETIEPDMRMMHSVSKLMEALDWNGLAEIEFRLDKRDSTPKLMEINARCWGSMQTAIEAGIDFPNLLYKLVTEGSVQDSNNYKIGVKSRWLSGDIRRLIRVFKGDYFANKQMSISKLQELRSFMNFERETYDGLFWEDIIPFLYSFTRLRMVGACTASA